MLKGVPTLSGGFVRGGFSVAAGPPQAAESEWKVRQRSLAEPIRRC